MKPESKSKEVFLTFARNATHVIQYKLINPKSGADCSTGGFWNASRNPANNSKSAVNMDNFESPTSFEHF
jgi:hypothetical protein